MRCKQNTSGDCVVLIDWDGSLYAQWCQRCRTVTEITRVGDDLRCKECNHKMAEKIDDSYAKAIKEGVTIQ